VPWQPCHLAFSLSRITEYVHAGHSCSALSIEVEVRQDNNQNLIFSNEYCNEYSVTYNEVKTTEKWVKYYFAESKNIFAFQYFVKSKSPETFT